MTGGQRGQPQTENQEEEQVWERCCPPPGQLGCFRLSTEHPDLGDDGELLVETTEVDEISRGWRGGRRKRDVYPAAKSASQVFDLSICPKTGNSGGQGGLGEDGCCAGSWTEARETHI